MTMFDEDGKRIEPKEQDKKKSDKKSDKKK
jgi:hypothetical protein